MEEGNFSFLTSESSEHDLPESSLDGRYMRVSATQLRDLLSSSSNITIHRAVDREEGNEVSWISIPLSMIPEHTEQFLADLDAIAKLNHPNLMRSHTKWLDSNAGEPILIMIADLIPGDTLREHLQKIKHPRLKRVRVWAAQLLSMLHYLHTCDPPRIHGDLTPEKIYVVSRTGDLKVGGLGLSTCFRHHTVNRPLTEFTAPDSNRSDLSPSIDIYSFGMCLLEICTSEKPYRCCQSVQEAGRRASQGVLPLGLGRIDDVEIRQLISMCISSHSKRPTAAQLLSHPFFSLPSDEERLKEPVKLRAEPAFESWEEPKIAENPSRKVKISISVPIQGVPIPQNVDFEFDLAHDTPKSLAEEMVEELDLPRSMEAAIADKIIAKLGKDWQGKGTEESTETNSPPSERTSMDSIGESPRVPYIRRRRKFSKTHSDLEARVMAASLSSSCSFGSPDKRTASTAMISSRVAMNHENNETDVRNLQMALNLTLKVKFTVDGHFTQHTAELVSQYQENIGHIVNGEVTPQLWDILLSKCQSAQYEMSMQPALEAPPMQRHDTTRETLEHLTSWEERLLKNPLE